MNHTTAILQDGAECVLINLENVPKPNYVMVNQCFMNVVFPDCMSYITLLLIFTPLSIQTMKLTGNISMFHQVKSLPTYFTKYHHKNFILVIRIKEIKVQTVTL